MSFRKYDLGCSSRIPDPDFLPIPDPQTLIFYPSRIQGPKAPDPDPQHCNILNSLVWIWDGNILIRNKHPESATLFSCEGTRWQTAVTSSCWRRGGW